MKYFRESHIYFNVSYLNIYFLIEELLHYFKFLISEQMKFKENKSQKRTLYQKNKHLIETAIKKIQNL